MNNQLSASPASGISLKNTVGKLATSLIPLALEHRSFIINHISPAIELRKNEDIISYTLSNLLRNVLMVSKEQCIHVMSNDEGDCTIIRIASGGTGFYHNLSEKITSLQRLTQSKGGSINLSFDANTGTTISFSCANYTKAA